MMTYIPSDYSVALYTILGVGALWLLYQVVSFFDRLRIMIIHRRKPHDKRDSARLFSDKLKRRYNSYCGNRCEGTGILFRCRRRGHLQGDHWFPHARGGQTNAGNLVMLCSKCNKRKSAKVPTVFQTYALYFRRKMMWGYTAAIPAQKPGDWLTRKERKSMR